MWLEKNSTEFEESEDLGFETPSLLLVNDFGQGVSTYPHFTGMELTFKEVKYLAERGPVGKC